MSEKQLQFTCNASILIFEDQTEKPHNIGNIDILNEFNHAIIICIP